MRETGRKPYNTTHHAGPKATPQKNQSTPMSPQQTIDDTNTAEATSTQTRSRRSDTHTGPKAIFISYLVAIGFWQEASGFITSQFNPFLDVWCSIEFINLESQLLQLPMAYKSHAVSVRCFLHSNYQCARISLKKKTQAIVDRQGYRFSQYLLCRCASILMYFSLVLPPF